MEKEGRSAFGGGGVCGKKKNSRPASNGPRPKSGRGKKKEGTQQGGGRVLKKGCSPKAKASRRRGVDLEKIKVETPWVSEIKKTFKGGGRTIESTPTEG